LDCVRGQPPVGKRHTISTDTNTAGTAIAAGSDPDAIAITPDGTTASGAGALPVIGVVTLSVGVAILLLGLTRRRED
jgi:hypothetical protein